MTAPTILSVYCAFITVIARKQPFSQIFHFSDKTHKKRETSVPRHLTARIYIIQFFLLPAISSLTLRPSAFLAADGNVCTTIFLGFNSAGISLLS